jgi:hypothetical protein
MKRGASALSQLRMGAGKGGRSQLCEAPAGPFRQLTPDTFTRPTLKLSSDKALVIPQGFG